MREILIHQDPTISVAAVDRDTYVLKRPAGSEMGIVTVRFGETELTETSLLAIVTDRLVNAQLHSEATKEQEMALFCIHNAMLWLQHHRNSTTKEQQRA